jgi:dTDP-L-rhamnose 4-epimerase
VQLLQNKVPVAFEDGLLQRDYVHVQDVVDANVLVTRDDRAVGHAFNVGSGVPTTVLQYAEKLSSKIGKSMKPQVPGIYRMGDARHSVSSIDKLRRLGWRPQRTLDEILEDFLKWVGELGDLDGYSSDAHQELMKMSVLRMSHAH